MIVILETTTFVIKNDYSNVVIINSFEQLELFMKVPTVGPRMLAIAINLQKLHWHVKYCAGLIQVVY